MGTLLNEWQTATPEQQQMYAQQNYYFSGSRNDDSVGVGSGIISNSDIISSGSSSAGSNDTNINNYNLYDSVVQHNFTDFYLPSDNGSYCQNFNGNYSYLNVSCESNLQFSLILYGYFTPILLLVTMVANSLIVVVLSRRNMASPTNSVLMGKC